MPSRHARHWPLDPDITFLNHGSFGACPTDVLDAQSDWRRRMEAEPVRFLARDLDANLTAVRSSIGAFVGADPDDLALVTNATGGVNVVVRSLQFEAGDEILSTDHEYNAVLNVLRHVAARDGARVVIARLPFPQVSADDIVARVAAAATDRTRLAVVSHVTSPTALVFPIERIVAALADRGIDTLVDGAHAPGMIPLDLRRVGAAYYAGNLHKWVCAPKGTAFLHVRRDRQEQVRPQTISHGANAPGRDRSLFRREFDWQGTLDPTGWLAIPTALSFVGGLEAGAWPEVMERNRSLAIEARVTLSRAPGMDAAVLAPEAALGAMAALPLPASGPLGGAVLVDQSSPLEADPLQSLLYERFAIEVPVYGWPVPAAESPDEPRRLIRVSVALYNDRNDVDRLVAALTTIAKGA